MRAANDRLVLCPYGIPVADRAACLAMLFRSGGDLSRLIDSPTGAAPFLAHIKRLSGMLAGVRPPIVLLTSVVPLLAQVVLLRKQYEAELSPLRNADWLLYVDTGARAFLSEAQRLGKLDKTHGTPTWQSPSGGRYLVVSPDSAETELARAMLALRERGPAVALLNSPRSHPPVPVSPAEAKLSLRALKR